MTLELKSQPWPNLRKKCNYTYTRRESLLLNCEFNAHVKSFKVNMCECA